MTVVESYLTGLRAGLAVDDLEQLGRAHGARPESLQRLTARYPLCPPALLELLSAVDGTHFRGYPDGTVTVLVLGSDVGTYPYYLSSVDQIIEDADRSGGSIRDIYGDYLDEDPELVGVGVDPDLSRAARLCFSNCMNNGGTSRLYLDFGPADGGVIGQVVRYLHDPDSYLVIAADFEEYLQQLIDREYDFLDD